MDSISQLVLGAAVGEAVLGKKLGNKALLWGAAAGTLPDLDIFFNPVLDQVTKIAFHRGISHSFFGICLAAPFIAWLVYKWYKGEGASYWDWFKLFFWGMITHPILDTFTTYGTQLWLPFSDKREALCSIFVADPLYTIPLILSAIFIWRLDRTSKLRRWLNYGALGLSTAYLLFTVYNRVGVIEEFADSAAAKNIAYSSVFATPTPLNNILWYGFAEVDKGYHLGMYSVFDTQEHMNLTYYPRNEYLLDEVEDRRIVETLKWFSDDKYIVTKTGDTIIFHDIRFGKAGDVADTSEDSFVFNFHIWKDENGKWNVKEVIGTKHMKESGSIIDLIYERGKGI